MDDRTLEEIMRRQTDALEKMAAAMERLADTVEKSPAASEQLQKTLVSIRNVLSSNG